MQRCALRLVTLLAVAFAGCADNRPAIDDRPGDGPGGTWPGWRGDGRDGVAAGAELLASWGDGEPRQVWRRPLGAGYAGIAVAEDRVFTIFVDGEREVLVALAAADGAELWRLDVGPAFRESHGDGPRSTPAVADGAVYALGALGELHAASSADGAELWSVDLTAGAGGVPTWGYASSPLVRGARLYVHAGGGSRATVYAIERGEGTIVWSAEPGHPGYSSPRVAELAGELQLISFLGAGVVGLDPATGERRWHFDWPTSYGVNAADPIPVGADGLFISSGYGQGAALLRIASSDGGWSAEEVWRGRTMSNHFNSSILWNGIFYGFDNSILSAIDAASGERLWRQRGFGKGSLIATAVGLVVLGEQGELALVEATPEEYRESGRVTVFEGRSWTPPALAGRWLYLRNQEEIVCLNLGAPT